MKRLVNRISHYLKIYYFLVRFSVIDILVFRTNALVMGLAPIVWLATMLIFIATIFSKVNQLGGWSFWEVVFLTGVHEIIFLLTWATFLTNLRRFIDDVRMGRFDQTLLKPINSRFLISFKSLDFTTIGSFLNVIFVFFFSFGKVINKIDLEGLIVFVIMLGLAYWICYLVYFIFASLSLFFINSKTFLDWIFDTADFDRYPAEIYPLNVRILFTFFLPILFFAYVPTALLLGKLGNAYLLFGLIIALALYLVSRFIWQMGLRHYQSASS